MLILHHMRLQWWKHVTCYTRKWVDLTVEVVIWVNNAFRSWIMLPLSTKAVCMGHVLLYGGMPVDAEMSLWVYTMLCSEELGKWKARRMQDLLWDNIWFLYCRAEFTSDMVEKTELEGSTLDLAKNYASFWALARYTGVASCWCIWWQVLHS